jgi:hypothetical protein
MVILQYLRAKELGYPENIAKAIGYAQALKYAIFKNTTRRKRTTSTKQISSTKNNGSNNNKNIEVNKTFRITFDINKNYPVLSNKLITEKDFEEYFKSFGEEILNRLLTWGVNIINQIDNRKDLEIETRFFNNVWKMVRDEEV